MSAITIPGYTIEREIGHGGKATVYLAVQESLGRKVALKVFSTELLPTDGTWAKVFQHQLHEIARLSQTHIASIHDIGCSNCGHWFAMEYIPGGDLKQRIREGLNPIQVLGVLEQVADALGYMHARNMMHGDVRPENILFRADGSAVLANVAIRQLMTNCPIPVSRGVQHYISPEEVRGRGVDSKADIYALGIVLYEMLTGKLPYEHGDRDYISIGLAHVTEPVPVLPDTFGVYQSILNKMLAKSPTERLRHGQAVAIWARDLRRSASSGAANATEIQ